MNRLVTVPWTISWQAGAIVAALAMTACDSRATASGSNAAVAIGRPSSELESCGTTAHCSDGLRCVDQTCSREARSTVGDYLAARGARELAAGKVDGAIASYAEALASYESDQLGVPPDLDCAYGQALARGQASKDKGELAARVLHRCLLALPPGGPLRRATLGALAELHDAGLDPRQLGKAQLADRYLTRAPEKPATDRLTVAVTADPPPKGKSYAGVPERLAQPDLKAALVACWERNFAATATQELTAKVGLKVSYRPSEYEDEAGTYAVSVPASTGAADGQACVRAAVEPALTGLKTLRDAMDTTLTITVK